MTGWVAEGASNGPDVLRSGGVVVTGEGITNFKMGYGMKVGGKIGVCHDLCWGQTFR